MREIFDFAKIIRMGLVAVGALAAWGAWLWQHDSKVLGKERATVERKATQNANKADAARRSAEAIPAGKLKDRYFRD